jgi:hypothetical protein
MLLMKRLLVCLVMTCLVWSRAPGMLRAGDIPTVPVTTPEKLYDISWPDKPPCTAQLDANCSNLGDRDPFQMGMCDFQFMSGWYKKANLGPGGPAFDYIPIGLRFGCMLTDPLFDGSCFRGTVEGLLEVNYDKVIREFGHYASGANLILRYNFVQTDCIVVPYFQGGAGFVLTDGYKWPSPYQRLIGEQFEFLLRIEAGARVMLTECVSLDVEAGVQHISNACLAKRNAGVNNTGITVGFTYFFGKIKQAD